MSEVPCPACSLPISTASVDAGECPCCGHSFREPVPLPPPPADTPPSVLPAHPPAPPDRRPWVIAGVAAIGGLALVTVGVFVLLPSAVPAPTEQARLPDLIPAPLPSASPKPAPPTERETLPPPRIAEPDPPPMPKPEPLPKPEPPKPDAAKVMTIDPADGDRKLDAPGVTAELLPLDGDTRLTLTGKVKVLRVGAVNGQTLLDASKLDATEVVFTDDLNGNPTITVRAGTRVRFERVVGGAVNLTADAGGGEVVFDEKGQVNGGAVLTLTAKRVDAQALLTGGAKVGVTLTSGGSLRTRLMDGGATVEYKAEDGEKVTVETGEMRGGARVVPVK